jgi:hypothetical protein
VAKKRGVESVFDSIDDFFGGNTDEEDARAREAIEGMGREWDGLALPDLQKIAYDEYKYQGDYEPVERVTGPRIEAGREVTYKDVDPRLAELALAEDSLMGGIETDPRLRDAQFDSLAALDELATGGGLSASGRANLNKVQSDVNAADRGRRGAIMQGMAQRGQGGSGMELLELLDSAQDATDRQSQASLDIAGQNEDRALAAIMNRGNMAGSIRGQEFGEDAARAEAQDAINRFNAGNRNQNSQFNTGQWNQGAQFNAGNQLKTNMYNRDTKIGVDTTNAGFLADANRFNAGAANDAGLQSWKARQGTSDANVDVRNQGKTYNAGIPQQQFENRTTVARGKTDAGRAEAEHWQGQGDRKAQTAAGRQEQLIGLGTTLYTGRKR